jgi:calcineurin-like phosphoesterase family protein
MIYLTSDQHFGHTNVIKYCNRLFKNTVEMDKVIIDKYNSIVGLDDVCFHVGDFTMSNNFDQISSILKRLNGVKHLILGNHDRLKPFQYVEAGYTSVHTSLILEGLYLAHDPSVGAALPKGATLLHGHVHGLFKEVISDTGVVLINVGVDVRDMAPISLNDIKIIKERLNGNTTIS